MGTVSEPGVLLRDFPFAKSGRGPAQSLVDKGGGAAETGPGSLLHMTLDRPPRRIPKIRTSSVAAKLLMRIQLVVDTVEKGF